MHIVIAGGSGLIGQALVKNLTGLGHRITVLSRQKKLALKHPLTQAPLNDQWLSVLLWNGHQIPDSLNLLHRQSPIDVIINLCGTPIATYWTSSIKKQLLNSRVHSTQALVRWCHATSHPPHTWIQASGIDYYALNTTEPQDETSPMGQHFLAQLSQQWEKPLQTLQGTATRCIIARIAPVLSHRGGMMPPLLISSRCFLGHQVLGPERVFSWIHIHDLCGIFRQWLQDSHHEGVFNISSPKPILYNHMMKELGEQLQRPMWLPLPPKLLTLLMGEASTLILDGRFIKPQRIINELGYNFTYPNMNQALQALLTRID